MPEKFCETCAPEEKCWRKTQIGRIKASFQQQTLPDPYFDRTQEVLAAAKTIQEVIEVTDKSNCPNPVESSVLLLNNNQAEKS